MMSELSRKCELYQLNQSMELRNELLLDSMSLVELVARQMRNLYIHYWGVEDSISMGVLTTIDCIEHFDIAKGINFEAFVYSKVKFRIIDELRSYGFIPRRVSSQAKKVNHAYQMLSHELLRSPSDEELADYLGMDVKSLSRHYQEVANSQLLSIDEMVDAYGDRDLEDTSISSPEELFSKKMDVVLLEQALGKLSEKEQTMLNLYYVDQFKLKEIAEIFEVSEARVSQIHAQAIKKLQIKLKEDMG